MERYDLLEAEEALKRLRTQEDGLSSKEASIRLGRYGPNDIERAKSVPLYRIVLNQFTNPVVYVLLLSALVTAMIQHWTDFAVILVVLTINTIIGTIQESKAQRAIEALREILSPKAKVYRDGVLTHIDSKELVPGDVIRIEAGDKVPADCRILTCEGFQTMETALTGESAPIIKSSYAMDKDHAISDRANMVFAGTIASSGWAIAAVCASGRLTEIGKIATLMKETEADKTPLQQKLHRLGGMLSICVLISCAIVFGLGLLTQNLYDALLQAVALGVAAIPEGLPAIVTITLAIGIRKMASQNALIRNLPSAETLGSCSAICTDKTGTLTRNEMTITKVYANHEMIEISGSGYDPRGEILKKNKETDMLLLAGILNNNSAHTFEGRWKIVGDPTEGALIVAAKKAGLDVKETQKSYPRVGEITFSSERKAMTTIHREGKIFHIHTKGAIETVLPLCKRISIDGKERNITQHDAQKIHDMSVKMAQEGLRVLAFASKRSASEMDPERDMTFIGLVGMIDTPREEAKDAVRICKEAGIKVVMITGDHIETARQTARELGIEGDAVNIHHLSGLELHKHVGRIGVYARVSPADKLRIIEALKKAGHTVAMTGDGINDAPALKRADIGVAMGSGLDVAKEASAMVITDDDFATIVKAVREGRKIYANISKFVMYAVSNSIGEVLAILLGILSGIPMLVLPRQILWVNIITDVMPALALGMEAGEPDIMRRKPRRSDDEILTPRRWMIILSVGALMACATIFAYTTTDMVTKAQTMAFTTLVFLTLANSLLMRSEKHTNLSLAINWRLIMAIIVSIMMQYIVVQTSAGSVLGTVPLSVEEWMMCAGIAMIFLAMLEAVKMVIGGNDPDAKR